MQNDASVSLCSVEKIHLCYQSAGFTRAEISFQSVHNFGLRERAVSCIQLIVCIKRSQKMANEKNSKTRSVHKRLGPRKESCRESSEHLRKQDQQNGIQKQRSSTRQIWTPSQRPTVQRNCPHFKLIVHHPTLSEVHVFELICARPALQNSSRRDQKFKTPDISKDPDADYSSRQRFHTQSAPFFSVMHIRCPKE